MGDQRDKAYTHKDMPRTSRRVASHWKGQSANRVEAVASWCTDERWAGHCFIFGAFQSSQIRRVSLQEVKDRAVVSWSYVMHNPVMRTNITARQSMSPTRTGRPLSLTFNVNHRSTLVRIASQARKTDFASRTRLH